MPGPVALHGGGEYVAGDEPAMDALMAAAVASRGPTDRPLRVVLVPTAVARHRPALSVSFGRTAFEAAAGRAGVAIFIEAAMVVDAASAADPASVRLLEAADLIHLPGGDPDVIPTVLAGSPAWEACVRSHARGACLAGASAGAMALAARLWTARGPMDGLGVVRGVAVLPHFEPSRLATWRSAVDPGGELTWLGLAERTLVIGGPDTGWQVAGAGRAHVIPPGADRAASSAGPGERIDLPVG